MIMILSEEQKLLISDLNYLIRHISFINESLDMDFNPDLFKNRIIEDIFFIHNTLNRIEKKLDTLVITENEFVPILKKIKSVKDNTIILLENILKYKYRQSGIFDLFSSDFRMIAELYKISSDEIGRKLGRKQFLSQPDNQISREELHFLFVNEESDQD